MEDTEVRNAYEGENLAAEKYGLDFTSCPHSIYGILGPEAAIKHHMESQELGPVQTTLK
jgi:hypothetical protein